MSDAHSRINDFVVPQDRNLSVLKEHHLWRIEVVHQAEVLVETL